MKRILLELELYQIKMLEQMRDRHPRPYLREKAAALLKIATGETVEEVAQKGLLKKRVCGFFDQFDNGSSGLLKYVGLSPG